ncbi:MAG: hypothetical protein R6V72_06320 [Cyclobacterium sp.]|uniref:hypothetical protein n=1 Tax=unclassified Cyclobacterium TaxID=2615055 RepID=UPI0013D20B42|nr:hypothetical protein [Cyclobacterium sp. SYSU L10401]
MKKGIIITVLALITGSFCSHTLLAQNFYKEKISRNQYLQGGLGLGTMYADNYGGIRKFNVKFGPTLSFAYGRKLHNNIDLRGNFGFQNMRSQDQDYFNTQVIDSWQENGQAVGSKNNMLFLDLMPTIYVFGSENHTSRKKVNIYTGTGLGLLLNFNEETRLGSNGSQTSNHTHLVPYIPIRGGISYKLNIYTDISLEGTLMMAFSDKLDGNIGFNRFNDRPLTGQIVFRRYLNPIKAVD